MHNFLVWYYKLSANFITILRAEANFSSYYILCIEIFTLLVSLLILQQLKHSLYFCIRDSVCLANLSCLLQSPLLTFMKFVD